MKLHFLSFCVVPRNNGDLKGMVIGFRNNGDLKGLVIGFRNVFCKGNDVHLVIHQNYM